MRMVRQRFNDARTIERLKTDPLHSWKMNETHLKDLLAVRAAVLPEIGRGEKDRTKEAGSELGCSRRGVGSSAKKARTPACK